MVASIGRRERMRRAVKATVKTTVKPTDMGGEEEMMWSYDELWARAVTRKGQEALACISHRHSV